VNWREYLRAVRKLSGISKPFPSSLSESVCKHHFDAQKANLNREERQDARSLEGFLSDLRVLRGEKTMLTGFSDSLLAKLKPKLIRF